MPKCDKCGRKNCCCSRVLPIRIGIPFCPPAPPTPPPACFPYTLFTDYFLVESAFTGSDKLMIGTMSGEVYSNLLSMFPPVIGTTEVYPCQLLLADGFKPMTVYMLTAAERTGNFFDILSTPGLVVYDSTTATLANPVGSPFGNNIIPSSYLPSGATAGIFAMRFVPS
jgi:hypothetical protein